MGVRGSGTSSSPLIPKIGPDDPRYRAVVDKRFNKRFAARPDYVQLVASTDQVESALSEAVSAGCRVVVTSGGHCLEGFVADPDVRVILDISPMKRVYFDAERGAVAIEAGATVGEAFRALSERWGTLVPLGEYPGVGIGGHVAGGAFGFLCRQHGLAADYLYAVEVVTVDGSGRPRTVIATCEPSDPNRELVVGTHRRRRRQLRHRHTLLVPISRCVGERSRRPAAAHAGFGHDIHG